MTKTLQHIKNEWAKHHGYIDYKEFYELTRFVDTDQVFIMDGAVNQIAIRYAQEQNKELVEMLEMYRDKLELSQLEFYNKYGFNISELHDRNIELIKSATEG